MSGNYTRMPPWVIPFRTYGFQKVGSDEMKSIIMRVQRPTHSSDSGVSYYPEGYFKHPHRPNSGYCKRATPSDDNPTRVGSGRRRAASPRTINRVVRRLQTPTLSRRAANGQLVPEYELQQPAWQQPPRPRTAEEKDKFLQRITRPTTASRRRDLDNYWEETLDSENFNGEYPDERPVEKEELDQIIERVRTPTVCSNKSEEGTRCRRRKASVHINRDKLPLVSGLARSKKLDEIVDRLYRPTSSSSSKRSSTTATDLWVR